MIVHHIESFKVMTQVQSWGTACDNRQRACECSRSMRWCLTNFPMIRVQQCLPCYKDCKMWYWKCSTRCRYHTIFELEAKLILFVTLWTQSHVTSRPRCGFMHMNSVTQSKWLNSGKQEPMSCSASAIHLAPHQQISQATLQSHSSVDKFRKTWPLATPSIQFCQTFCTYWRASQWMLTVDDAKYR